MARLESIAIGGYFATPEHLIQPIAEVLDTESLNECRIADPCAGEGIAATRLALLMGVRPQFYLCELEAERHKALLETLKEAHEYNHNVAFGDAFQLQFSSGIGLLYLNPPYDLDPVHGRLEQRFLDRFTATLADDGMLVFVVPFYALKASAVTLATHYDDLTCYRFPREDFEFKQVVLFARKTDKRLKPDPQIIAQVEAWAASALAMPVLGSETKRYKASAGGYMGPNSWVLREIDITGLLKKVRPWRQVSRTGAMTPVPHILPEVPVADLMFRTFPVATAPRPAHIAAGIASGLFNGRRVSAQTKGLPDLLVKGVFAREYVTVEEKENKDGEITGLVQVQQPKLVTTVLDLSTKRYSTLKVSGKSTDIEDLSIEGLLEHYGTSLLRVMSEQCPVIYDPQRDADKVPLAPVSRKLFTAQCHAAKAIVSLLGGSNCRRRDRRNKAAILLGEIGSGKTTVAVTSGRTIGRSMLVMCPPHLLQSWTDETLKVIPNAEIRILQDVADVDALAAEVPTDKFLVAILSRETSKLGHSWASATGACPKCGAALPEGDLAKKRQCCEVQALVLNDPLARAAHALAIKMAPYAPGNSRVRALLHGRTFQKYLDALVEREEKRVWPGFDSAWVSKTILDVLPTLGGEITNKLFALLLLADYSEDKIVALVRSLLADETRYYTDLARYLTLLLPPDCEAQKELRASEKLKSSYYYPYGYEDKTIENVKGEGFNSQIGLIKWSNGKLTLDGFKPGSLLLAKETIAKLSALGAFLYQTACGEPLFQAIPEPRRYALSRYIASRHPKLFDMLVLDEGHEYATDGSAQERAAHRLTALGIPTLLMTGSIMNGYAESLFSNMWALSADFRDEFARDERSSFVDRYGYHKRVVSVKEGDLDNVIEFGAVTDRVERSARITGDAPGVLPLFLFRHLLKISVTLHKADLAVELPACHQIKKLIKPSEELQKGYVALQQALVTQIRKDRFEPKVAGKLFGALAELPSYLDRASLDTGNQEDGTYEIRYPKSLESKVVARGASFPADQLSTKEEWMLETIKAELAEGRNVMVFSWHVCLLPRLARLIKQAIGEDVPILHADKVAPVKRQDWIDKNVVRKNRRVLLANPVAIQTGLNNLVHFATEIWMENPACNPTIFRQAIGRIDRIGQTKETRIYTPIYAGTLQEQLHDLLLRKVAVAISTDGLDPESALIAAGAASDGFLSGLSLGKQLWAMLQAA